MGPARRRPPTDRADHASHASEASAPRAMSPARKRAEARVSAQLSLHQRGPILAAACPRNKARCWSCSEKTPEVIDKPRSPHNNGSEVATGRRNPSCGPEMRCGILRHVNERLAARRFTLIPP
jgi:hypothetical protein